MLRHLGRTFFVTVLLAALLALALPAAAVAGPTLPMPPGPPIIFTGSVDYATQPYADHFVYAEAGTVVAASLDCTEADGLYPMLAIYQPDGTYYDIESIFMSGNFISGGLCPSAGTGLIVAPMTGIYAIRVTSVMYATNFTLGDNDSGGYILKVYGASLPAGGFSPNDGRINADPTPPVVMYCTSEGIDVYARNADDAYLFSVRAPKADYEALGTPATNTLLASNADGSVRVYLLSSGEFQVNAYNGNEEYVAIWSGCPISAGPDISVYDRTTGELLARGSVFGTPWPSLPPLDPGFLHLAV